MGACHNTVEAQWPPEHVLSIIKVSIKTLYCIYTFFYLLGFLGTGEVPKLSLLFGGFQITLEGPRNSYKYV